MSITSTTDKVIYDGDGGQDEFDWNYQLRSTSDIEVIEYTEATGAEDVKVLNADYTVAIDAGFTGATVTMNSAPASTVKLILRRKEPLTNNLQFRNHDGLLAENVAEAIDRLVMQNQRQQEQLDRCLKFQTGEDSTNPDYTVTTQIPTLTNLDTNGKFIKLVSDGDATPVITLELESSTTANGVTMPSGVSTDNAIAKFDGTDGTVIQNSGVIISDNDDVTGLRDITPTRNASIGGTLGVTGLSTLQSLTLASGATVTEFSIDGALDGNSDTAVPTEQAVRTYVDNTGSGDFYGPGSSTTNAFVRFSDGDGKTGQNSQTTEDVSGNVTVTGDLTVSGNDIYSGSGTINTDFDNNRGNVNLELIANTNETSRILLQGDNNNTAASTALCMFDENGTANQRTLILELGQVTDEGSIRLQDDDGSNGRNLITFDMVNESATVTGDATVSGAFTASTGATITTGGLAVDGGDTTFAGDVTVDGDVEFGTDGTTATHRFNGNGSASNTIWFGTNTIGDFGFTQWATSSGRWSFGTDDASGFIDFRTGSNAVALTLDSSQDATFAGDVVCSGGEIRNEAGNMVVRAESGNSTVWLQADGTGAVYLNRYGGTGGTIWGDGGAGQVAYMNSAGTLQLDGNIEADGGRAYVGVDLNTRGILDVFGDAGSNGGYLRLFNGANSDTDIDHYQFAPVADQLLIGWVGNAAANDTNFLILDAGDKEFKITDGGLTLTKGARYTEKATLTSGTTVTWDTKDDPVAKLTLAHSVTTFTINDAVQGRNCTLEIVQGASYTITWPSSVKFAGGTDPDISTGTTFVSLFCYDGTNWVGAAIEDAS